VVASESFVCDSARGSGIGAEKLKASIGGQRLLVDVDSGGLKDWLYGRNSNNVSRTRYSLGGF